MHQQWNDLLFAHWRVSAEELRKLVPTSLDLDLFDGESWVGVVPFWMSGVRFRLMPPIPGTSTFPELNVRTYVRDRRQGLPGVYFFSLDATNLLAVLGARASFRLPYFHAKMNVHKEAANKIRYTSCRRSKRRPARFEASYWPLGEQFNPLPGTLEYFLAERYCLYTVNVHGDALRCNIHHSPWHLRPAEGEIFQNSIALAAGILLPPDRPLLHYAEPQEVLVWPLEPA